MVDLAGSEGVRRTGHIGQALTEGSHINRGLLGIGNIFKALSDGNAWVPYRDTVMGSVLQGKIDLTLLCDCFVYKYSLHYRFVKRERIFDAGHLY